MKQLNNTFDLQYVSGGGRKELIKEAWDIVKNWAATKALEEAVETALETETRDIDYPDTHPANGYTL